jgi:hypothetical protein
MTIIEAIEIAKQRLPLINENSSRLISMWVVDNPIKYPAAITEHSAYSYRPSDHLESIQVVFETCYVNKDTLTRTEIFPPKDGYRAVWVPTEYFKGEIGSFEKEFYESKLAGYLIKEPTL